jgi:hypothetical protein
LETWILLVEVKVILVSEILEGREEEGGKKEGREGEGEKERERQRLRKSEGGRERETE